MNAFTDTRSFRERSDERAAAQSIAATITAAKQHAGTFAVANLGTIERMVLALPDKHLLALLRKGADRFSGSYGHDDLCTGFEYIAGEIREDELRDAGEVA